MVGLQVPMAEKLSFVHPSIAPRSTPLQSGKPTGA